MAARLNVAAEVNWVLASLSLLENIEESWWLRTWTICSTHARSDQSVSQYKKVPGRSATIRVVNDTCMFIEQLMR
jgi:hypothetical protein